MTSPSLDADPIVGRRIGSYVVEKRLGAGGMGAVYIAVQPDIGKRVAVKFLAAHLSSDPAIVARFFDEARAVNLIQHENIVDIFDFGRTADGYSYFVMELLGGRSLGTELGDANRIPWMRTREIVKQIADALVAAHALGIVHRDLKPDNVHLVRIAGRDDFVKVLDFGIAKLGAQSVPGKQTITGMVMGTPGFMAPEQAQGEIVDGRADVYALGVLLYRMLTGVMPFTGPSLLSIVNAQLDDRPRPLLDLAPEISDTTAATIHRMIKASPSDRPTSMTEVLALLTGGVSLVSQQPLVVPPTNVRVSTIRPRRRSRAWLAVPVVGAIVIAGLAYVQRDVPIAKPAPPPVIAARETFDVDVRSTPPGATVFVGLRELGTTPTKLTFDGPQHLRLHLAGFFDQMTDVATTSATIDVRLEPVLPTTPPPVEKPPVTKPAHKHAGAKVIGLDD